ncbi:hypothetical protein ACLI4Z_01620 [Natrialbaceae archaeon A-arb3/5]
MIQDQYDKRAISIGGYGTLVPYHGFHTYDPAQPGSSSIVRLPVAESWASPEEVLQFIKDVEDHLGADTSQGRLFYSFQCSDYGFHASGIDQLKEDIQTSFTLGEELQGTLESRYNREFEMHRPCFVILAPVEYGLFYLFLRGGRSYTDEDKSEWEISYDAISGVLMDNPVISWPNLEELIGDNGGGPITQQETDVTTVSVGGNEQELQEVYPLDQEETGDADIVAARNPFTPHDIESDDDDLIDAIKKTQHLTYRVKGGTIGFEKEASFTIKSMSIMKPENISFRGIPLVICNPMCSAHPAD